MGEDNVKVCVRCRPFSKKEKEDKRLLTVDVQPNNGNIIVKKLNDAKVEPKTFSFDLVYDWNCTQLDVFANTAQPVIDQVLEGYNGTIFAYGQTGTGKTFTMEGEMEPEELRGIIPRTFQYVFDHIAVASEKQFLVRGSYLEIYNEEVRDLLSKTRDKKLELKQHPEKGVYVKDLGAFHVKSPEETDRLLQAGKKNRAVFGTNMNAVSSRSHAIFQITIEQSETDIDGNEHIRVGRLNLVDLAGSERQGKTGVTGQRLKEATKINLSLSALGNVISALVDGKSKHIPYRDSTLTRLLQDSLGGNSKTTMVANIGPADYNYDETISTLRYASRTKLIKNKAKINEDPKDAMLRQFQEEIEKLKAQLTGSEIIEVEESGSEDEDEEESEEETVTDGHGKTSHTHKLSKTGKKKKKKKKTTQHIMNPEVLAQMEAETAAAREELLQRRDILESERAEQLKLLEDKTTQIEKDRKRADLLAQQLQNLEGKLIQGGMSLAEQVAKQEEEIMAQAAAVEEQRRQEELVLTRLEETKQRAKQADEIYNSVQEERDVKTKKLKKLYKKYEAAEKELSLRREEIRKEREELLDAVRTLKMQISLKAAIIEHFVPLDEVTRITSRSVWSEEQQEWVTKPVQISDLEFDGPLSALGYDRPMTESVRVALAAGSDNPRFFHDNIYLPELILPSRTTLDLTPTSGATADPYMKMALDHIGVPPEDDFSYDYSGPQIPQEHYQQLVRQRPPSRGVKR